MRIDRLLPSTQVASWIGRGDIITPSRQIGGDPLKDMARLTISGGSWTVNSDGISGMIPNQTECYILPDFSIEAGAAVHQLTVDMMVSGTGFASGTEARWGLGFVPSNFPTGYVFGLMRYNLGNHKAALLRDRVSWVVENTDNWTHDVWHTMDLTWTTSNGNWGLKRNGVNVAVGTYSQSTSGTLYPALYSYRNGNDPVFSARNMLYSFS